MSWLVTQHIVLGIVRFMLADDKAGVKSALFHAGLGTASNL